MLPALFWSGNLTAQNDSTCQALFFPEPDALDFLTVNFQDVSFPQGDITNWTWSFGDGETSTEQNPSHTYAFEGTYNVSLQIVTPNCSSTTTMPLQVIPDTSGCNCSADYAPVCVATPGGEIIEFPNECMAICEGFTPNMFVQCDSMIYDFCDAMFCYESDDNNALEVIFHDFSFSFSTITGWAWDFGDGATSTEQNPTHLYADYGVYPVSLTITTEDGCSATGTMEVWLEDNAPCNCSAEYNPVCVQLPSGETVPFWNACEAACYGFTDYVACDSVATNDCEAFFGYYQDFLANDLTVNFEDYSYASTDITAWVWDFGDGATSTEQNPTHTYTADGEYTVTLVITSGNCTSTTSEPVFVGDFTIPDCQAFFWPFPDSAGTDLTYDFYDLSLGAPTTWAWDFGDGNTSTEQNPTHTYAAAGTYTVSLAVSGPNCQSSFELILDTDEFFTSPNTSTSNNVQALFTPVIDLDNNSVYFKNQSTSTTNITDITYNFGDGQNAVAENVHHTFPAKKSYNVTMQVKNAVGQTSNFVGTIDLETGMFKSSTASSSIILSNPKLTKEDFSLSLQPNPATADLTVAFTSSVAGKYNIEITSVTGQSLYSRSFHGAKGANRINIDVQNYPQGIYLLKLQVNDSYQTFKLVKE